MHFCRELGIFHKRALVADQSLFIGLCEEALTLPARMEWTFGFDAWTFDLCRSISLSTACLFPARAYPYGARMRKKSCGVPGSMALVTLKPPLVSKLFVTSAVQFANGVVRFVAVNTE